MKFHIKPTPGNKVDERVVMQTITLCLFDQHDFEGGPRPDKKPDGSFEVTFERIGAATRERISEQLAKVCWGDMTFEEISE